MFKKEKSRIYLENEKGELIAEITFPEMSPGVYTINHTFVDDSLRGQGVASKLVQAAVDEIERLGGTVKATCSYAVAWFEKQKNTGQDEK